MDEFNIIICGVGGQGNILLERVIGMAAIRSGLKVRASDTFGAAQRGGSVQSQIRLGHAVYSSLVPQDKCHVIIGLEPGEALRAASRNLAADGIVLVNTEPVLPPGAKTGKNQYPPVARIVALLQQKVQQTFAFNATAVAKTTAGSTRYMNTVMAGAFAALALLPIDPQTYQTVIKETTGALAETNLSAFEAGFTQKATALRSN